MKQVEFGENPEGDPDFLMDIIINPDMSLEEIRNIQRLDIEDLIKDTIEDKGCEIVSMEIAQNND